MSPFGNQPYYLKRANVFHTTVTIPGAADANFHTHKTRICVANNFCDKIEEGGNMKAVNLLVAVQTSLDGPQFL